MAEEGTLGLARASQVRDGEEEEPSKEDLQRRMEEARESITQTVTEIKETVTNQYYSVKETVSDALDWRHHFRQRPIAFSVGALSVGFLVGYGLAGTFKGDGGDSSDYPSYEDSDVYARTGATPSQYEDEHDEKIRRIVLPEHSYAAQSATGNLSESSEYAGSSSSEEEQKPGLFERFKETSAYDRLQSEVSSLGDRFIDQLSSTAHHVVLPALFNKIKGLFGVDLSNQQGQEQSRARATQTGASGDSSAQATNAQAAGASASAGASNSSYATSENRGYGAQSSEGASSKGSSDSVLDLDR